MKAEIKIQDQLFVFDIWSERNPERNTIYRKFSEQKFLFLFKEVRGEAKYDLGVARSAELNKHKDLYLKALNKFKKLKAFL